MYETIDNSNSKVYSIINYSNDQGNKVIIEENSEDNTPNKEYSLQNNDTIQMKIVNIPEREELLDINVS